MLKKILIALLVLTTVVFLAGCKSDEPVMQDETPAVPGIEDESPVYLEKYAFTPDTFPRIDGSPGAVPLAEALAAAMLGQSRDDLRHLAMFTATTQSFRNLADELCDMLLVSEPYPPAITEISGKGFRYDMAPVAVDALVFIVSKSNPVDNLSTDQIKAIYSGSLTGWQDAGGNDLDIAAFQRNEEAASQVLMEKLVMDWDTMADAPMQTIFSGYSMFGDDAALTAITGFDGSINAIGYTTYYYAVNMGMASDYKILSIDGFAPSPETIASGAYPFVNPYYAVVSSALPEDDGTRILFNWLLSDDGQAFISSEGYVSVRESQASGGMVFDAPSQMRWDVAIDSSTLAPYTGLSPHSTRLRDSALPALEPSDAYGQIFPYSTAVTMNDGSIYPVKYGFVTIPGGMVITDPVYDSIERAICSEQTGNSPLNAYLLHMSLPKNDPDFGFRTIQSACAGDGSWITPYNYENIVFRRNVFFCQNDYFDGTFDIDVYDYSGKLLYNILDLEWADRISENTWPEYLLYGVSDNYGFIQLDDDTYALMDVLTGAIKETDFVLAGTFSDGLAAVVPGGNMQGSDGLWGFTDKDLELLIPAQYTLESVFVGGRAIVETPDGAQHVIDKSGATLFSVEPGNLIVNVEGYGYAVYSYSQADFSHPRFFTYDFTEIDYPPEALPLDSESNVFYMRGGWIACMTENGNWLFNANETHPLPDAAQNVVDFYDGVIIFNEYDSGYGQPRTGVMLLDGTVIIPALDGQSVVPVYVPESPPWFAVNINTGSGGSYGFAGDAFTRAEYQLVDPSGQVMKSGSGVMSYDVATGYLIVQGSDYFSVMHIFGDALFYIPSMGYSFD